MEKYRRWADAATGINPFTMPRREVAVVSAAVHSVLLPLQIVFGIVLCLALFLLDLLSQSLRVLGMASIARCTAVPVAGFVNSLLLWVVFRQRACSRVHPLKPTTPADGVVHPRGGDVVICNQVSPLDALVMFSAAPWAAFATLVFVDPRRTLGSKPSVVAFGPTPMQRWKAWRHVWATTSSAYLERCSSVDPAVSDSTAVDIAAVIRHARKQGVPVVVFPESTTTNGKGVLPFPFMRLLCRKNPSTAEVTVFVAAFTYEHPHAPRVVDTPHKSLLSYVFTLQTCSPSWSPKAIFTFARPSASMTVSGGAASSSASDDILATVDATWTFECRAKIAAAAQGRGSAAVCKPVAVGLREKLGFLHQLTTAQ